MSLNQYPGYIFDLDGTVYRGGKLVPGADAVMGRLRARGARIVFLSNNPVRSRAQYAQKLAALGIPAGIEEIVNSSFVMIEELRREAPRNPLYVVGEESFRTEMREAGFRLTEEPREARFVILSFDRTFHYGKLLGAHQAVKAGARIWATNPDRTCPTEDGDTPDCATLIAAVEACTNRKVEKVVGKPSPIILQAASRRLNLPLPECLVVGDRLDTDIAMARQAGCPSAVVLTGVTTRSLLQQSPIQPDYVLDSIAELP